MKIHPERIPGFAICFVAHMSGCLAMEWIGKEFVPFMLCGICFALCLCVAGYKDEKSGQWRP